MPKNIVVFSDGTGQEGGSGHDTNIYKIYRTLEDRTQEQVAFYDPGLGTTGYQRVTGIIGGNGISRNIKQCYRFIFDHFEAGDRIFLFGFSRGAATVRSLSSFIHYFGVLPKSRPELIDRAYKLYKNSRDRNERQKNAMEFVGRHRTIWTRIRFLGCYDTVAALGLPLKGINTILDGMPGFKHSFHDFFLSEAVENAFHAIAIDDERKTFHPLLWNTKIKNYQKVLQVWFAGMHTDVGGGYEEQTLSDIPLTWLTQKAIGLGLQVYPKHKVEIREDENGRMHDSRGSFLTQFYRRKPRTWKTSRSDKPVVHESVLKRTSDRQNEPVGYKPWILKHAYDVEPWVRAKNLDWVQTDQV